MTVVIANATIDAAREFFEARGAHGCEGTAMIASNDETTRLVIPTQEATPAPHCTVSVTDEGKLDLVASLANDERYVARIHSHPASAFHSATDDANPAITFDGALSIVAPFFGLGLRTGFDSCAVFRYNRGRWIELHPGRARDAAVVIR